MINLSLLIEVSLDQYNCWVWLMKAILMIILEVVLRLWSLPMTDGWSLKFGSFGII